MALQGSATAAAPHLVLSLDTRGRSGVTVRYRLRDVDAASIANAVQPVALQYRVGSSGDFTPVPGGLVADATTGPGQATLVTPVAAVLPAAADDQPLVQLRILTTNALGQDEWVGVDDIEVDGGGGSICGVPAEAPPGGAPPSLGAPPTRAGPVVTGLTVAPAAFTAARRGAAVMRGGRAGALLRFRLSRPAEVEFRVASARRRSPLAPRERGRFSVGGRPGLNRLRFTGRLGGRALPAGPYRLRARATDQDGLTSRPARVAFRIK